MLLLHSPSLLSIGPGQEERGKEILTSLLPANDHCLAKTLFWAIFLTFCSGNRYYAFYFLYFSQVFIEASHSLSQYTLHFQSWLSLAHSFFVHDLLKCTLTGELPGGLFGLF